MRLKDLMQKVRRKYHWECAPFPDLIDHWIRSQWGAYDYIVKYINLPSKYCKEYSDSEDYKNTIWIFWDSGEENSPRLVKVCINSARKCCPKGWSVCVLDINKAKELSDLPDFIWDRYESGKIPKAQFSDLLRLSLLLRWGGIWSDSTVFWTSSVPVDVLSQSLFMFQSPMLTEYASPIKCSSWFIKADKNNPLLSRVLDLLLQYHEQYCVLIHYYIFHLTLASLVRNKEPFMTLWEGIPYYDNNRPHILQFNFEKKYTNDKWNNILSQSFVHKLTYKFDKYLLDDKSNLLNHVLSFYG